MLCQSVNKNGVGRFPHMTGPLLGFNTTSVNILILWVVRGFAHFHKYYEDIFSPAMFEFDLSLPMYYWMSILSFFVLSIKPTSFSNINCNQYNMLFIHWFRFSKHFVDEESIMEALSVRWEYTLDMNASPSRHNVHTHSHDSFIPRNSVV